MTVIPVMQEAEIRRIMVPGQPRQKKLMRPHLNGKELAVAAHICHPCYCRRLKIGGSNSRLTWSKSETLSPK
jgi:hypothetical protein